MELSLVGFTFLAEDFGSLWQRQVVPSKPRRRHFCLSRVGSGEQPCSRGWAVRPVGPAAPLPALREEGEDGRMGGRGGGGGWWGMEQGYEPASSTAWKRQCYIIKPAAEVHLPPVRPPDDAQHAADEGEGPLPPLLPWHHQPCCQPDQEEEEEEAEKVRLWLRKKLTFNSLSGWHWAAQMILQSTRGWAEVHRPKCKLSTWGSSWRRGWWGRPTASSRGARRWRWGRGEMIEGFTIGSEWERSGGDMSWGKVNWEIPQIPQIPTRVLMQARTRVALPRRPPEISSS